MSIQPPVRLCRITSSMRPMSDTREVSCTCSTRPAASSAHRPLVNNAAAGQRIGDHPALPMAFGAEFFELCPHRRKPPLEDTDDLIADLGGREDGSVYKPTPTINLILGAD